MCFSSPHVVIYNICRSVLPRNAYVLFSTKSPSTIQRIPWPGMQLAEGLYATWYINEEELPWLLDSDGTCEPLSSVGVMHERL